MGHRHALHHHPVGLDIDQAAAGGFAGTPAVEAVASAQGRGIGRGITTGVEGQAIEMATVFRCQSTDERGAPLGGEAPRAADRGQTVEQGVDQQELPVAPGQVMGQHRSGEVTASG